MKGKDSAQTLVSIKQSNHYDTTMSIYNDAKLLITVAVTIAVYSLELTKLRFQISVGFESCQICTVHYSIEAIV